MLILKEITEENFKDVINLEVEDSQKLFVAPNVRSIAECYLYRNDGDVFPYAICFDGKPVGFLLVYTDDEENSMTIWRIMIDKNQQKKGYWKQAMILAEDLVRSYGKYEKLYTSYCLDNINAKKLYLSLGYIEDRINENCENEMIVVKDLKN